MAFSGFSINLVLVGEKNITTKTFGLSDMYATQTLGAHFFGEQTYLQLVKEAHLQQQRLPNTRQKKLSTETTECKQQI